MIVLDTNVISAAMCIDTEPEIVAWLDRQPPDELWITAVTVFEVRFGIAILPAGRRRRALEAAFALALRDDLENRILPFDRRAADAAGDIAARRRASGNPVDVRDTQIAGIVTVHSATLATRNVSLFQDLSVPVVNPWDGD